MADLPQRIGSIPSGNQPGSALFFNRSSPGIVKCYGAAVPAMKSISLRSVLTESAACLYKAARKERICA
jgi:hypothetical protein